jgi:putative membrane protein
MLKTGVVIRWLILTAAIMLTSYLLDGIQVSGFFSALLAAAILGVLNVFFRPVLLILTLPFNILTLGLFTFVINAVLLMMASGVISGFSVRDFWSALIGSLLISFVNAVLGAFVDDRKEPEKDSSTIEMRKTGNDRWE